MLSAKCLRGGNNHTCSYYRLVFINMIVVPLVELLLLLAFFCCNLGLTLT